MPCEASSSSKTSSSSSSSSKPSGHRTFIHNPRVERMRCVRCAKCVETIATGPTIDEEGTGMISFGYNLWYCERCAKIVGYHK
ncbi:hypothetical protein K3495_g8371 [Podosphaera aphanis]|nr:hypothetical protein K3495_g8371 [Podosphaera aphanis]